MTCDCASRADQVGEASPRYAGWRVTFVCFVMAIFCWGFGFYGHGFYLAELQQLNHWPASLISGASTAYYFFSAILVVFVSDAIARMGPRTFVLAGLACLAASVALLAVVDAIWQLFVAYLIMSFGWAGMSVGAITNVLGLWFDHKRGLAISLALVGASVGGMLIVPALVYFVRAVGFGPAMIAASMIPLAVLGPLTFFWIVEPPAPEERGRLDPSAAPRSNGRPGWTRSTALRSFAFWTVSAPSALALLAQVGFLVHQIAFLEPVIGRAQAGLAVAVTTFMSVAGRLGLGTLVERLDCRKVAAISLVSQAAALFAMTQATNATALTAACAVFGLSIGNITTLPALIIQREFDAKPFGMLTGLATAISQFTYAFGPGLLGVLHDATGSYTASLMVCAVLDVIAAVIVVLR